MGVTWVDTHDNCFKKLTTHAGLMFVGLLYLIEYKRNLGFFHTQNSL
jgi:hypothetical protein